MYLIDTNIWLERLLDQERSAEVGRFLSQIPAEQLLISDFTVHSIGVILGRLGRQSVLPQFINDVFVYGSVGLVTVLPEALYHVVSAMEQFSLDFDDAYQYVAAQPLDAVIVSFDKDLDRTDCGRQTPASVIGLE